MGFELRASCLFRLAFSLNGGKPWNPKSGLMAKGSGNTRSDGNNRFGVARGTNNFAN
jgi:hypothetical protein